MHRTLLLIVAITAAPAYADELPIITLSDDGPSQEVPTDRSFYVVGEADDTVENAQAIVVRRGSSGLFGAQGPPCHELLADLRVEATSSAGEEDEDGDLDDDIPSVAPRYEAGLHRVFELFPYATMESRHAPVLVAAAWRRTDDDARQYKVLVPHEREFFAAGYGYCLFVVRTERAQHLDDPTLNDLIEGIASKIVSCGDKASCDEEALAEYEVAVRHALNAERSSASRPAGEASVIAGRLKELARSELGTATGIVEALDRMGERWYDQTNVLTPAGGGVWLEISTDPFAQALSGLLAHAGALLPQVRAVKGSTSVALFTTDGKIQVKALQLLDDGRSIRVASSKAPGPNQARVIAATTEALDVADGLTLYDLLQLGHRRVRVERDWTTLKALGERVSGIGLDTWTGDDAAYLDAAAGQLRRLADFVDLSSTGIACAPRAGVATEAELVRDAVRRQLGEWLACQRADATALETMREQLAQLGAEAQVWQSTKDKLLARSRRVVTLTTVTPTESRVSFASTTWVFSYVTPIVGYAGVLRPDESFGLFYVGAQIHLAPNPVAEPQWQRGVTTQDVRRALALEIAVAPYGGSFGPDQRYEGPGGLPPIFLGVAAHVLPYTSLTFGGAILDRRHSTLREEDPRTIFAPYLGLTVQLNLPDLIRQTAGPRTHTTASR